MCDSGQPRMLLLGEAKLDKPSVSGLIACADLVAASKTRLYRCRACAMRSTEGCLPIAIVVQQSFS